MYIRINSLCFFLMIILICRIQIPIHFAVQHDSWQNRRLSAAEFYDCGRNRVIFRADITHEQYHLNKVKQVLYSESFDFDRIAGVVCKVDV